MLEVHRSESGLSLVSALADLLAVPPADPFTPDVVAVPAQGIERWLAQRLSHRLGVGSDLGVDSVPGAESEADGVCAHVLFPRPQALLDDAVSAVSDEHAASVQAWEPARTVWVLVDLLEQVASGALAASDTSFDLLRHHLKQGHAVPTGRRYSLARRVAGLLHAYAASRPQVLRDWQAGDVSGVPGDLRWQPELWRLLRAELGPSPAELLDDACTLLRTRPDAVRLPERFSLYGPSRIDAARLDVLVALAQHRNVHLWLNHASPALWQQVSALAPRSDLRRRPAERVPGNALLASLSRDVQELQERLAAVAPDLTSTHHPPPPVPSTSLLGRLLVDLRDASPPGAPLVMDTGDRSVQVHACHGRARQVEVLRDVVLGLLADDPTLEPRDVLVMCPDVETFAPLVTAAFGTEPAARLRVRLADRSPRQVNPVLAVVGTLLELVAGRVTASALLALAGAPPVRRRFRLDEEDLEQLRAWTVDSGAHWGLDGPHRNAWKMGAIGSGTWRVAMDRVLSGVALGGSDQPVGGVLPLDGIDSGAVDLAGRFAELVDRVHAGVEALGRDQGLADWLAAVEHVTLSLVDVGFDDAWQLVQLRSELGEIRDAAEASASPLSLADVRTMLDLQLQGRPTRSSFRSGGLTVCTLVPMRSVPHRVVCLLGMDDLSFPRRSRPDGDDLLAREPHLGERDPRSEDRQLFLDAITAVTERLVVVYQGAHERTGAPLPPAVPVGELLDAIDACATTADGRPARQQVVVRHPLQPFDPRNFTPGELGRPSPLAFDRAALDGARSSRGPRESRPPFIAGTLPAIPLEDVVELSLLRSFLKNPANGFLRQRLEVADPWEVEQLADSLPVELDGLGKWKIGESVLAARMRGLDAATVRAAELARGALPPDPLGDPVLQEVGPVAEDLLHRALRWREDGSGNPLPVEAVDVDVRLAGDRHVVGSISGLRAQTLLRVSYSRLAANHRLEAWIDLVVLAAQKPETAWEAAVVGRGTGKAIAVSRLRGPTAERANEILLDMVRIRDLGLRVPLPLPVKTTEAYAFQRWKQRPPASALYKAGSEWASTFGFDKEDRAAEHVRVWGGVLPLAELVKWQAPERIPAYADEGDDFGRLACRLWWDLFEHEELL